MYVKTRKKTVKEIKMVKNKNKLNHQDKYLILSLHFALSKTIFSSLPSRLISLPLTLFQVFLGLLLPLTLHHFVCSSLLTDASHDLHVTRPNHLKRFALILFSVTPTFILIYSSTDPIVHTSPHSSYECDYV